MMTMYVSPNRRNARVRRPVNRLPEDREMRLAVDVMDIDDTYEIKALVPGLDTDDINIEVINNTVAIRGEFKELDVENSKTLRSELPVGRFSRVITLPTKLDVTKGKASLKNGVFTLSVPKTEDQKPKVIKVKAA
jgi:HSP20 family protein